MCVALPHCTWRVPHLCQDTVPTLCTNKKHSSHRALTACVCFAQRGVLVVLLSGGLSYLTYRWWVRGKEAQKPDLATAASGDPITGTQKG